jgi:hypothetical protein
VQLLEERAAGRRRVLAVAGPGHAEHRQLDFAQALPPVLRARAKATEQAMPAQAFQRQTDRLVLRATLEPGAGQIGEATQGEGGKPFQRRNLQRPVAP